METLEKVLIAVGVIFLVATIMMRSAGTAGVTIAAAVAALILNLAGGHE